MKQELLWLWMQQCFGVGTHRAHEALARYASPQGLLALSPQALEADEFLTKKDKRAVRAPDFGEARRRLEEAEEFGAACITPESACYPACLREIHAPPYLLYAVGDLSLLGDRYRVTMVGAREPDEYGLVAARGLSGEIGAAGGVVVSGLARGIDAACHRGALEAGAKTIALLAAGLDLDYPHENAALRRMIEKNGLVLTEYPLGSAAYAGHFPVRNRLLSGISLCTVAVRCALHSGSMTTVAHALSQNRDVYAVPGEIYAPLSSGANLLLHEGAAPLLSGASLLARYEAVYGWGLKPTALMPPQTATASRRTLVREESAPAAEVIPDYLDERQAAVLSLLGEPQTVDTLCEQTRRSPQELLSILTQLEIFGLAEARPGRIFCRAHR